MVAAVDANGRVGFGACPSFAVEPPLPAVTERHFVALAGNKSTVR
ncbi:hypothetical protein [Microbacterium sp. YY-01]